MRYVDSRLSYESEMKAYRFYITDSMYYQGQGKAVGERYSDMINKKIDIRTPEQVLSDTMKHGGLRFKNG